MLERIIEHRWGVVGLFTVLTFILYGNTLSNGYNMDDELVTMGHRLTSKGLASIPEIFTSPYYQDDMGYSYEYRPITHLTFAIEHGFLGERPSTSHLVNLLLFLLSVVMVHRLVKALFPSMDPLFPLLTAVIFLVHPIHAEAVASIKNREEILSLLGGIVAALMLIRWIDTGRKWYLLLMVVSLIMGLLSKMSVLSFVIILPMIAVHRGCGRWVFAITVALCAGVLGTTLAIRTNMPLEMITGAMLLLSLLLILFRSVFLRPDIRLLINTLNIGWGSFPSASESITVRSKPSSLSLVLSIVALSMVIYGYLYGHVWLATLGTTLLFIHPLVVGRISLLVLLAAIFSLIPLLLLSQSYIWYTSFFLVALIVVVLSRLGYRFGIKTLVVIHLALIFSVVSLALLFRPESSLITSKSLLISILLLPAYFSGSKHFAKLRIGLALLSLTFIVVTLITKETLPELPELVALGLLMIVITINMSNNHLRRFVVTVALILPVLTTFVSRPVTTNISINPMAISTARPQPLNSYVKPKEIPLTVWLGKSTDRPLTLTEFPLGFNASWPDKIATSSWVIGHYLRLMVIGGPQAFYYGYSVFDILTPIASKAYLSAIAIILLLLCASYGTYHNSPWSLGILAGLVSLFLFSNLVEPVAGMAGDRLTYVASFGYCIALGYALTWLYERQRSTQGRSMVAVGIVLLLVTYSGMTIARNAQWKDALTLMRHDIEHVPNSAQAHNLLASHLMKNSFEPEYQQEAIAMRLEALSHFKEAVRIWPDFFNVWFDLGRTYLILGESKLALSCFKQTHKLDSTFYQATFNVATIAEELKDTSTAIYYYNRCIQFNPEMLQPYTNLSYLYFRLNQFEKSIAVNQKAIAYHPNWTDPYDNIARVYSVLNQPEKAEPYLKKLQELR